jgi:hypothetical protein
MLLLIISNKNDFRGQKKPVFPEGETGRVLN